MRSFRPTIRLRLTLLYGGLFLTAGIMLLLVNYTLVRQNVSGRAEMRTAPFVEEILQLTQVQRRNLEQRPAVELIERLNSRSVPDVLADFEADLQQQTLDQLVRQSLLALLLTCGVAVVLGWIAAGRVLQPVHQITATARSASQANLRARVDLDGPPDELKDLADTFDTMLARLEMAFESQRRFAAQASHELRTPISVIRAEADVTLAAPELSQRERDLAVAVRVQADRSEALIDGLLALARSESALHDTERLDIAALAGDVVGEHVSLADQHGVEVHLSLLEGWVFGDRLLLERCISNLAINAITHSKPGPDGRRWMRLSVQMQDGSVALRVANSGADLSGEDLDHLFEPFSRRDQGRRYGVGLGLTIVRSIALTHGGSADISPRGAGGLVVTVRLPGISRRPASGE